MDNAKLRILQNPELAHYLRQNRDQLSEEHVSKQLLEGVESQALAPIIFCTWFTVAKSPSLIDECLKSDFSLLVRSVAIRHLGKRLHRKEWAETLQRVGGVPGLSNHISRMSVTEVKMLTRAIGNNGVKGPDQASRREIITKLFKSLLLKKYQAAQDRSLDGRDLVDAYVRLLPACTSGLIESLVRSGTNFVDLLSGRRIHAMLFNHHELIKRLLDESITSKDGPLKHWRSYFNALADLPNLAPSPDPGLTLSMYYLQDLLRRLAEVVEDTSNFQIVKRLVEPLLRRMRKRGTSLDHVHEVIRLAVRLLWVKEKPRQDLGFSKDGLLHIVAAYWRKDTVRFEEDLSAIIKLMSHGASDQHPRYEELFSAVPRELRYRLLSLCYLNNASGQVDIENEVSLGSIPGNTWSAQMFLGMAPEEASPLLERLIATRKGDTRVRPPNGTNIYTLSRRLGRRSLNLPRIKTEDSTVLLLVIQRGLVGSEDYASQVIDEQRKLAATTRDQEQRGFHAQTAIFFAAASGSLTSYGETLKWARRFLRDPLNAKHLFSKDIMQNNEGIQVLSGIPQAGNGFILLSQLNEKLSATDIRARVQHGNEILLDSLETLRLAYREPGIHHELRAGIIGMFGAVVLHRMQKASYLKRALQLSDDMLYEVLWESTLEMLLQAERIGLDLDDSSMGFKSPYGPVGPGFALGGYGLPKNARLRSTFRFIDNLARARDVIWQDYRPRKEPGAASLPVPWPKGLPIQYHTELYEIALEEACGSTPYLFARAKAILFADPSTMMAPGPSDDSHDSKTTRKAIGHFVDRYGVAAKIYVCQAENVEEKKQRYSELLRYATTNFKRKYNNPEVEVERDETLKADSRFYKKYLRNALSDSTFDDSGNRSSPPNYPFIPQGSDVHIQDEWNPEESRPSDLPEVQPTPVLAIDFFLEAALYPHGGDVSSFEECKIPCTSVPSMKFSIALHQDPAPKSVANLIREAQVVAALLYLDAQNTSKASKILRTAFPSPANARYPPLFLSEDFLSSMSRYDDHGIFHILQEPLHLSLMPTKLLTELVGSTWQKLLEMSSDDAGSGPLEKKVYQLLQVLANSDAPYSAAKLLLDGVIDRPNASAWHRIILPLKLFRRLPAYQARDLLQTLASRIGDKLAQQTEKHQEPGNDSGSGKKVPLAPFVKVSTIKHLAQLLDGANFVSPEFSVELLRGLLTKAAHIDVRTAVVQSLLQLLRRCDGETDWDFGHIVLDILKEVIPIATSIHERQNPTEEGWRNAEKSKSPPEVYDAGSKDLPPILDALVGFINQVPDMLRDEYMNEIIYAIIERSKETNGRWLWIFAVQNGVESTLAEFPLLPVKPYMLTKVADLCRGQVHTDVLKAQHSIVMLNISPSERMQELLTRITADPAISKSPSGAHFLSLAAPDLGALSESDFFIPKLLFSPIIGFTDIATVPPSYFAEIESLAFEQANALIHNNSDITFPGWNMFLSKLRLSLETSPVDHSVDIRLKYGIPFLERLVVEIDSLRQSHTWRSNPERKPPFLPPTTKLTIYIAIARVLYKNLHASSSKRNKAFTSSIAGLIRSIATQPDLYDELPQLISAARKIRSENFAAVAAGLALDHCAKGELDAPTRETYWLIDVAADLIRDAMWPKDDGDLLRVKDVLGLWSGSEDERVRMAGEKLRRRYQKGEGDARVGRVLLG